MERDVPEVFERCGELIAERRENPTDDLTSVLVHAEIDGEKLEEHEIVMGFFLLDGRRQRQHQGDLLQRHARADGAPRAAAAAARRPVADPRRRRGVAADVPRVRPLPPHRDARHRARTASRSARARRSSCGTSRPTATRRATRTPTASTSRRNPEHQAFGAGGRHFCLGHRARAARAADPDRGDARALSPRWSSPARPQFVESPFVNQLKTLPVRLGPRRARPSRSAPLRPQGSAPPLRPPRRG